MDMMKRNAGSPVYVKKHVLAMGDYGSPVGNLECVSRTNIFEFL